MASRRWTAAACADATGVKFGTSGARGRVRDFGDDVAYTYARAFLETSRRRGELSRGLVAVGGDLRSSTPRLEGAVFRAVRDAGCQPVACGRVPSPALALFGFAERIPSIMVTGSHIPDDRNGMKMNTATRELLKSDEPELLAQVVEVPEDLAPLPSPAVDPRAADAYRARYLAGLPPGLLAGLRVGVYEHSAVGRDLLGDVLRGLGAAVTSLGRSEAFVPVDTEALRPEDVALAAEWARGGAFDALVSTDGDSDRPLVSDAKGRWLRGDVVGLLTARFLAAGTIVTPVSSTTAIERSGSFARVVRTRIGSPYVVAAMEEALARGERAVGFEANGGFLLGAAWDAALPGGPARLSPLPTRDALIVILAVLAAARGRGVAALAAELPPRAGASDRLEDVPQDRSARLLEAVDADPEAVLGLGPVAARDRTDGLRLVLASGDVVHLRPSGNAPELRCYVEADDEPRAAELLARGLGVARALLQR